MRHTGLVNRVQRVEAARSYLGVAGVAELAQRIAEAEGISAMEIIAEAERVAAACR